MNYLNVSFALGVALIYLTVSLVYHLFLSPLAKFPGPRLAALSRFYELYYDGYKLEGYAHKLRCLHKQYGPIVRISPYEIHINDPDLYLELYGHHKLDKYHWYYNVGAALVTTPGRKEHQVQRAAVHKFFQPQALKNAEMSIIDIVESLCSSIGSSPDGSINLSNAYRSLTNDVVTSFYFASSNHLIDEVDYAKELHRSCGGFLRLLAFIRQFPIVGHILTTMSRWLSVFLKPSPKLRSILQYQQNIGTRVNAAIKDYEQDPTRNNGGFIYQLLGSSLPVKYKSPARLHTEVLGAIIAGTEATANVLITATFYLLCNPTCCERLKSELMEAWQAGCPSINDLLQLPYLSYVILEASRLQRGSEFRTSGMKDDDIHIGSLTIPAGTPFSFTPKLIHENEGIFHSPQSFNPDRWRTENSHKLKRYLGTFSKGGRSCLGKHLAERLIFVTIAHIFHRFDLSLDGMDEKAGKADGLLKLFPQKSSIGLRVNMAHVRGIPRLP